MESMTAAGYNKAETCLNKKFTFILMSMLAGMYIGFGDLMSFTIGGLCSWDGTKILMGAAFAGALSIVIMAGAELFTGNIMVIPSAVLDKKTSFPKMLIAVTVCWFGNYLGAIVLAFLYKWSGLTTAKEPMLAAAASKVAAPAGELFVRGILCNILVCLAVWCSFKLQSEAAKIIMIFWCVFFFFTCGYEHSVANMTVLFYAFLEQGITYGGLSKNLFFVSLGNAVGGGIMVLLPYYLWLAKSKTAK